jgi:Flp pilus assembly protein TadD
VNAAPPTSGLAAAAVLQEGLRCYLARDFAGAHAAFARAHRLAPRDPRVTSWYGLTLVVVERNLCLGALYCDEALRAAGPEPDLLLNQARVELFLGRRQRAMRALAQGLQLAPHDPPLLAARQAMGWRRRPVLPFLPRGNPLNVWLGKLRHRWKGSVLAEPPSAATLGLSLAGAAPEA